MANPEIPLSKPYSIFSKFKDQPSYPLEVAEHSFLKLFLSVLPQLIKTSHYYIQNMLEKHVVLLLFKKKFILNSEEKESSRVVCFLLLTLL